MRKHVFKGTLTLQQGLQRRDILLTQPVQLMMDEELMRRAYDLATQFNRPTAYDSQYLAVAEHLGCEFWTADERFYNSLYSQLQWVQSLNHFSG
jgi:predicted nucleic acid-binding protein